MINIAEELKTDFLVYATEVNTNRAFPDARDGLKPVQRATLWTMYKDGYFSNKPHVKSAKVNGACIARFHPHSDTSVYETVVRMSQNWLNNICEIDFHGANGSLLGGPDAASSRYTECRLSKASEDGFFSNIDKDTVDMILNFSEDEKWPSVFPAIFPRLFVNGSQGIGYTIAQTWLPGNLIEFKDQVKNYIETGKIDYDKIAPDFPTGGVITNKKDISQIYRTGVGSITLRGKVNIENQFINITELPYQVYAEAFIQKVKDLVNNETLTGIEDICNKSDDSGLLIEIECSDNPQLVLNKLYKNTDLEISMSANQMALVNKVPVMLNLEQYIKVYLDHNLNCIKREYQYLLTKAEARLDVVSGLLKALSIIDQVIYTIKNSKYSEAAKTALMTAFDFTEIQAKAIIDMKLGKLANMEQADLEKEQIGLEKDINRYTKIINSEKNQIKEFLSRLDDYVDKYGAERKTLLLDIDPLAEKQEAKKLISTELEDYTIILTKGNALKRIKTKDYKPQKKILLEEDKPIKVINAFAKDRIILISNMGIMYKIQVDKIPICNISASGQKITEIYKDASQILNIFTGAEEETDMFFITKQALVKKIKTKDVFSVSKLVGAPVMKINAGDEIIDCRLVNDSDKIVVAVNDKIKNIDTSKFISKGRSAGGVSSGIKLRKGQEINIGGTKVTMVDLF